MAEPVFDGEVSETVRWVGWCKEVTFEQSSEILQYKYLSALIARGITTTIAGAKKTAPGVQAYISGVNECIEIFNVFLFHRENISGSSSQLSSSISSLALSKGPNLGHRVVASAVSASKEVVSFVLYSIRIERAISIVEMEALAIVAIDKAVGESVRGCKSAKVAWVGVA
jgi:multisubunit Na+/H+ antiporter MnhF subunit